MALGIICPSCGAGPLPAGIAFCTACGSELARPGVLLERKIVSVVFVDLVGFTAMSEALDPEEVRRLLGPYYQRVREELEGYGGTVEKFIGDAVMALFGAPVAHEDDAERAVRAGYAVLQAVRRLPADARRRRAAGADRDRHRRGGGGRARAAAGGRCHRPRRRRQHGVAAADGRAGRRHPGGRAHLPGDPLPDRLPAGAAAAGEGQGRAGAGVVGGAAARAHRRRPGPPAAPAGRPRARDAGADRRARPRRGQRRAADRDAGGAARDRQVAPGLAAAPAPGGGDRHGVLAAGPLAALRRRRHLLGAGRDREGQRRHPRHRPGGQRRGEAPHRRRVRCHRRERGALDRGRTWRRWPGSPPRASCAATAAPRRSRPGAGSWS